MLYVYDYVSNLKTGEAPAGGAFPMTDGLNLGRLVMVADRGARTVTRYDGRGRVTGVARQIAKPGAPDNSMATRYAPGWFIKKANFDAADRPVRESTGATAGNLLGRARGRARRHLPGHRCGRQRSVVTTDYTARGTVKSCRR